MQKCYRGWKVRQAGLADTHIGRATADEKMDETDETEDTQDTVAYSCSEDDEEDDEAEKKEEEQGADRGSHDLETKFKELCLKTEVRRLYDRISGRVEKSMRWPEGGLTYSLFFRVLKGYPIKRQFAEIQVSPEKKKRRVRFR